MPWFWQAHGWHAPISAAEFWLATLLIDVAMFLSTYFAAKRGKQSVSAYIFCGFTLLILLNAFWHIGVALHYETYAPGVVTGVAINLPLTTYLLQRAVREKYIFGSGAHS